MEIAKNIHQISLGYVNVFLVVEEDGLVLIDAGVRSNSMRFIAAIRQIGHQPEDIKHIVLTHADPDHFGMVNILRDYSDPTVYASQLAADGLLKGQSSRSLNFGPILSGLMRLSERAPKESIVVDAILKEGDTLPFGGGLQVLETPGHTPGHLSFYFPAAKVLIAGDSMRANKKGLVIFDFKPVTWDRTALVSSVAKQAELGAEIVGVGHGSAQFGVKAEDFPKG